MAAIATPSGEGGIAIVRVSGPQCFAVADRVFRCKGAAPGGRAGGTFVFGRVVQGEEVIDDALCLIMRAPHSFTGEDTVEFQGHGGPVAIRRVLSAVLDAGARLAEPGEFTRRAFLNGKIDLLQAEAVLDVIRARSDRAAAAAVEQLEGGLSRRFNRLYDQVVAVAADLEASLDFPEDELPATVLPELLGRLDAAGAESRSLLATWNEGHLLRDGAAVVIAGRPNAGKSTLLNVLLGRDRAIVSHLPGTTRDVIEEVSIWQGLTIRLIDTAGLRESDCEIEREGIRRSRTQLDRADLFVYVIDASIGLSPEDEAILVRLDPERLVVVLNKTDLVARERNDRPIGSTTIRTSLRLGSGVEEVKAAIVSKLLGSGDRREHGATIGERHRELLVIALAALDEASGLLRTDADGAVVPACSLLKETLLQLGRATGRVYEDELLDSIFSRFCIGK